MFVLVVMKNSSLQTSLGKARMSGLALPTKVKMRSQIEYLRVLLYLIIGAPLAVTGAPPLVTGAPLPVKGARP